MVGSCVHWPPEQLWDFRRGGVLPNAECSGSSGMSQDIASSGSKLASSLPQQKGPGRRAPTFLLIFAISDCFFSSGTYYTGILNPPDTNNTFTMRTATQNLCLNIHKASLLCGILVYFCLSTRWSEICTLMFLFSKSGVVPGEEPSLIPITGLIVAQHDNKMVQILPILQPWVKRLTLPLELQTDYFSVYHQFTSNSSRISNRWLRPSLCSSAK